VPPGVVGEAPKRAAAAVTGVVVGVPLLLLKVNEPAAPAAAAGAAAPPAGLPNVKGAAAAVPPGDWPKTNFEGDAAAGGAAGEEPPNLLGEQKPDIPPLAALLPACAVELLCPAAPPREWRSFTAVCCPAASGALSELLQPPALELRRRAARGVVLGRWRSP